MPLGSIETEIELGESYMSSDKSLRVENGLATATRELLRCSFIGRKLGEVAGTKHSSADPGPGTLRGDSFDTEIESVERTIFESTRAKESMRHGRIGDGPVLSRFGRRTETAAMGVTETK